jgi:hypothetical protein
MVKAEAQLEEEIAAIKANAEALLGDAEHVDADEDERFGADRRGDESAIGRGRRLGRAAAGGGRLGRSAVARRPARRSTCAACNSPRGGIRAAGHQRHHPARHRQANPDHQSRPAALTDHDAKDARRSPPAATCPPNR